jgi:hypothetical protein
MGRTLGRNSTVSYHFHILGPNLIEPGTKESSCALIIIIVIIIIWSIWDNETQSAEAFQGHPLELLVVGQWCTHYTHPLSYDSR